MKILTMFIFVNLLCNIGCITKHIPKFQTGDCIKTTFHKEFSNPVYYDKIAKVGKTKYLLAGPSNTEQNIEMTDELSEKVSCDVFNN